MTSVMVEVDGWCLGEGEGLGVGPGSPSFCQGSLCSLHSPSRAVHERILRRRCPFGLLISLGMTCKGALPDGVAAVYWYGGAGYEVGG